MYCIAKKMEQILPFSLLLLSCTVVFRSLAAAAAAAATTTESNQYPPPCESEIYCHGKLLHTVQMSRIFKDSKTFVDMKMKYSPAQILKNFDLFMDQHKDSPSKEEIAKFVESNFDKEGSEFEAWDPSDWHPNPSFLSNISDPDLKTWAGELHSFWKELGRKIKDDVKERPELYSMIYLDHPVIVPGGRFREIFYWDSFWIMRGLLLSEMHETVKGMLSNLMQMVTLLGYVPNGGRIYFRRSQPPMLIPMFKLYTDATNDLTFLRQSIDVLDQEFNFWIQNRTVNVDLKGRKYQVVRYNVEMDGPRPESYREDYNDAQHMKTEEEKREFYFNLKAAAESGWDFSSRWFIHPEGVAKAELVDTKTRHIIPVELNALIYLNANIMAEYHEKLGNKEKSAYYQNLANQYRVTIEDVFWDEEEGTWFDYDMINKTPRRLFYASNIVPLWVGAYSSNATVSRVISYMKKAGALAMRGGVPTSMIQSGQQWDYPNGWAPLEYFVVEALDKADSDEANQLAFELAEKWIRINYKGYRQSTPNHMFEKYDVTLDGLPGGGGEYDVVVGFGWTNGVVMDFLYRFGERLQVPHHAHLSSKAPAAVSEPNNPVFTPATLAIGGITIAIASLFGIVQLYKVVSSGQLSSEQSVAATYQPVGNDDSDETVGLMQTDSRNSPTNYQCSTSSNAPGIIPGKFTASSS